jgi:hypothetical protein
MRRLVVRLNHGNIGERHRVAGCHSRRPGDLRGALTGIAECCVGSIRGGEEAPRRSDQSPDPDPGGFVAVDALNPPIEDFDGLPPALDEPRIGVLGASGQCPLDCLVS